jgi:hypothetical protein
MVARDVGCLLEVEGRLPARGDDFKNIRGVNAKNCISVMKSISGRREYLSGVVCVFNSPKERCH